MRVTKKQTEALAAAVDYFEQEGLPLAVSLRSLLEAIDAKAKTVDDEKGLSPAKIENALVMYSAGKVVPVVAARNVFWIKQYQAWKALGPTIEQVESVARWLGRQGWMSPTTIDRVVYQWPSYLARATTENRTQVQAQAVRKEFTGE